MAKAPAAKAASAAGRRFTDVELAALLEAWAADDGARLEATSAACGIALTLAAARSIERLAHPFGREDLLAMIGDALADPAGLAIREVHEFMRTQIVIAAVAGDKLVVAVGRSENAGDSVTRIWPVLRPWYRDLARNRERVDRWLAAPDGPSTFKRGRVEVALVRMTVAPARDGDEIAGLVAQIVAAPNDDAPRLVLADLLQQRGDPHGELIATQCAAAKLALGSPEANALLDRARKVIDVHGERLAGDVARRASEYAFHRGFVTSVTMTASVFSAHGERLWSAHPIRTLELKPLSSDSLAKLAGVPALERVRDLVLHSPIRGKAVALAPLGASPHLAALETLDLTWHVAPDWLVAFGAMRAPRLAWLRVYGGNLDVGALASLVASPTVPALSRLSLTDGASESELVAPPPAVRELFDALAARATLRSLRFDRCRFVTSAEIAILFAGPAGRVVESLQVHNEEFGDDALAAIAAAPPGALRELDVAHSNATAAGLVALLRSPAGARVTRLRTYGLDDGAIVAQLPATHPLHESCAKPGA